MTPKKIFLIFFVPLINLSFLLNAQYSPNNYTISFLPIENGLSQKTNRYMLQDSKGYMWISSQDGINRYNGKEFFHFENSSFYENCSPIKNIFGLVEDGGGDIWMGSIQGLYRYEQAKHIFKNYSLFLSKKGTDKISMPFAVMGGEVWVSDGGLSFKAINCKTQKIRTLYEAPDSLQPDHFSVILPQVDSHGNIWMADGKLIYRINTTEKILHRYPVFPPATPSSKTYHVTGISIHAASHLLAVATTKGVVLFDTEKQQSIKIRDPQNLVTNTEIWYVKAGKDFFLVSTPKFPVAKIRLPDTTTELVMDKKVLDNDVNRGTTTACLYIDKWDRLWINADGEYIAVIDFIAPFIKKIGRAKENGLPSGTLHSITCAGNNIWVSDSYLSVVNKTSGHIEKIFSGEDLPGNPPAIHQVFYDAELHRIWINYSYKIYYYDMVKNRFIKPGFEIPSGTNVDNLRCFQKLKSGELLAVYKSGVFKIDRDGKNGYLINEFGKGNINHLSELSGNRLALCVIGQPLRIFQYGPGLELHLIKSIELENFPIMVSEDSTHTLWAATEDGVYKIDSTYNIGRHYTTADGMANDYVYAVIPDKYGWIWCSTNKGIVAVNTTTDRVQNFDMSHNLQDLEFNNRCFATDNEGNIYFGGVKGLNYFKPPITEKDSIKSRLVIEEIDLNDTGYASGRNPDDVSKISYSYAPTSLSIKVQALNLKKAGSLKIIYRLKGEKEDWIEINNGENIRMFNLAPGNYQLEISYRDGNKNNIFPSRIILIQVIPPWYATWWFLLTIALVTFTGLWLILAGRQKQKLRKLQQENEIFKLKAAQELIIVTERERIITDLHDDVGATLSSLHIYGDLAKNIWHTRPGESQEMIEKISVTSKDLMGRMGDIIWSMKPADEEKYSFTARLKNYSNELLAAKNIECVFDIDEPLSRQISNPDARKNILLIAKEAMNNIAKYSEATIVNVSLIHKNKNILLTITDNGKGYTLGENVNGNGTGNIIHRCKQLQGYCDITATPGQGVKIACSFPVAIISPTA